jgi:hypothetical protein
MLFAKIQSGHGFHVKLGSLSGSSRKMRQKEVDILLAVEMLDHAFRKNMTSVALIAGDLDFAPLVESLVRLGTWVDVFYDPKSIAQGLLDAADRGIPLTFQHYYTMCALDFQSANSLPSRQPRASWRPENEGFSLTRAGRLPNGDIVQLVVKGTGYVLFVSQQPNPWMLLHNDPTVLENFFVATHCAIEWEEITPRADST